MDATAIEYREVVTARGDAFCVPEHILRVDDESMAGWQLRYGEWTDYPDLLGGAAGAERALLSAIQELTARVEYSGK